MSYISVGPWKTLHEMAANEAGSFFPTNPDLADVLGDTDFDLDINNLYFWDFWIPHFQVPGFPDSQAGWGGGNLLPDHTGSPRGTKSGRSKELDQDRGNPSSASHVWGQN